jgi:2-C-methyl-D-erythritol 2,4-cyclodiphosphate synthase
VRIGSGLDVHAFSDEPGRALYLGGVLIPDAPGLAGHSDGDVVSHALIDAVLGALALGDLGSRFGVDEPALAGARSIELLRQVADEVAASGARISNVDVTIVAQRPRLVEHRAAIASAIATHLGLHDGEVSVKVTSTDGLGAIGRGEGIACWVVCLVA